MPKYRIAIEVNYSFSGQLLEEYREWLDDYPDSEQARLSFLIDRFAVISWDSSKTFSEALANSDLGDYLDPEAKLIVEKNGNDSKRLKKKLRFDDESEFELNPFQLGIIEGMQEAIRKLESAAHQGDPEYDAFVHDAVALIVEARDEFEASLA